MHNYHSTYKTFASGSAGTGGAGSTTPNNGLALSVFVPLTPYLDATALWNEIKSPLAGAGEHQRHEPPAGHPPVAADGPQRQHG